MPLVVDASIAIAAILKDEDPTATAIADRAMAVVLRDGAIVPPHWWFEVANTIVMAARRSRIAPSDVDGLIAEIAHMGIEPEPLAPSRFAAATTLALRHGLTVYDAAYLELALRTAATLASLDRAMLRAASDEGVAVFR